MFKGREENKEDSQRHQRILNFLALFTIILRQEFQSPQTLKPDQDHARFSWLMFGEGNPICLPSVLSIQVQHARVKYYRIDTRELKR